MIKKRPDGRYPVGGNSIKVWIGSFIKKIGDSLSKYGQSTIETNRTKYVTNPTSKLYNPFTLVINFTVDVTDKYQIVIQGDYKQKYEDAVRSNLPQDTIVDVKPILTEDAIILTEEELFMIIYQNQKSWFKKY